MPITAITSMHPIKHHSSPAPAVPWSMLLAGLLAAPAALAANPEVIATGLNNPRGLAFGPEGALYVAEAGTGGAGPCVDGAEGEVCFGLTGSITRIWKGTQTRIATGLPSLAGPGGFGATGPQDISFQGRGNALVSIGLGNDPEVIGELGPDAAALGKVVRINPKGGWSAVADLAGFEASNDPDGNGPDSNPYSLLALPGRTVVADAGANALVAIRANGSLSTLAVFPNRMVPAPPFLNLPPGAQIPMQAVPNCVAQGPDGALYVGQLTGFPFPAGAASVYRVKPGQDPEAVATGFTNIIDLDFGPDGSLYVLELDNNGLTTPGGGGALIKVAPNGTRTTLLNSGLVMPTSVVIGPDGHAYLSNFGVFPGGGQVLRLAL